MNRNLRRKYQSKLLFNENSNAISSNFIIKTNFHQSASKYFELSNNNLTIKKTITHTEWFGAMCEHKLENGKVNEFSIKIDFSERFFIYIGFTTTNTILNGDDHGYNEAKSSWMCNLSNGKFKNGGVSDLYFYENSDQNHLSPGTIYTICIDTKNDVIFLKRNCSEIGSKLKLQISSKQKNDLIPCVDLLEENDQVSIII